MKTDVQKAPRSSLGAAKQKKPQEFTWSLPHGATSHTVDPCNVRGKTFKVIKNDETRSTKTAVVDAETQKTVAMLRRELQVQKLRAFEDLTRQRAKTVTVTDGGGSSSSSSGAAAAAAAAHEPEKLPRTRKNVQQSAAAQAVAAAAASRATVDAPETPNTVKNVFEVALEKVDLTYAIFHERLRMS